MKQKDDKIIIERITKEINENVIYEIINYLLDIIIAHEENPLLNNVYNKKRK